MKKLATLFVLLTLAVSGTAYAEIQETMDFEGHQNETAIQYLYDNEVVEGYEDGTFKPEGLLNRAELMKILVLGAGYDPSAEEYNNCFPDVTDEWFARYICFAEEKGWVEGYEDGNFAPGLNVNKPEAIKMLLETFEVNIFDQFDTFYNDITDGEAWYFDYIMNAYDLGLLEEEAGSNYYPQMDITRGQVSENIYRLLMDEQERFDIAAEKAMCDYFYFDEHDIITTPLEEVNPLLRANLEDNGFVIDNDATFDAITSRHSYVGNEFLIDPVTVCERTELSENFETAFSSCESEYSETIITLLGKMKYELVGMEDDLCKFTVIVTESAEETFLSTGTDMTCHFENTKTFKEMQEELSVTDACEGPLSMYN